MHSYWSNVTHVLCRCLWNRLLRPLVVELTVQREPEKEGVKRSRILSITGSLQRRILIFQATNRISFGGQSAGILNLVFGKWKLSVGHSTVQQWPLTSSHISSLTVFILQRVKSAETCPLSFMNEEFASALSASGPLPNLLLLYL